MATRPELHIAVAKTKSKASDYNDNFDMIMDFVDTSIGESKDYVDGFMPDVTGNAGKFLKTDGTTTSWYDLFAENNTFTGDNTFSGNITISGGTFDFPKCTTKPSTTSTASNTLPAVIVENYRNGNSWYRVYSDGFCEQGGVSSHTGTASTLSVSLLKAYGNTAYSITTATNTTMSGHILYVAKSNSSFSAYWAGQLYWTASGYLA